MVPSQKAVVVAVPVQADKQHLLALQARARAARGAPTPLPAQA
jgi:hypothetical protein